MPYNVNNNGNINENFGFNKWLKQDSVGSDVQIFNGYGLEAEQGDLMQAYIFNDPKSEDSSVKVEVLNLNGEESFSPQTTKLLNKQYQHKTKLLDVAQSHLGIVEVTADEYVRLSKTDRQKTQAHLIGSNGGVTEQWCAHTVSHIARESGMKVGNHKRSVQQYIDWAGKTYHSINTSTMVMINQENEIKSRSNQIKEQLPKMNEGDFIVWKTDYAILDSDKLKPMQSSHIGIIEAVDVKKGTITVIEGNANVAKTENGERLLVHNSSEGINGDQLVGETQEVNRRDGVIRKVYTIDELARYGYSGYIDNQARIPKK